MLCLYLFKQSFVVSLKHCWYVVILLRKLRKQVVDFYNHTSDDLDFSQEMDKITLIFDC